MQPLTHRLPVVPGHSREQIEQPAQRALDRSPLISRSAAGNCTPRRRGQRRPRPTDGSSPSTRCSRRHLPQCERGVGVARFGVEDRLVPLRGEGVVAVLQRASAALNRGSSGRRRALLAASASARRRPDSPASSAACEHRADELAHLRLGQRTLEAGHELPADHGEDGRDALHLQRLGDPRVGVDVDLGEHPRPAALVGEPLQQRRELLARLAPLGPQVDQHRHLERAVQHVGLERRLGDVDDLRPAAGAELRRRGRPPRSAPSRRRGRSRRTWRGGGSVARGWSAEHSGRILSVLAVAGQVIASHQLPRDSDGPASRSNRMGVRHDGRYHRAQRVGLDGHPRPPRGAQRGRRPDRPRTRRGLRGRSRPTTRLRSRSSGAPAARSARAPTCTRCPIRSIRTSRADGPMGPSRLALEQAGDRRRERARGGRRPGIGPVVRPAGRRVRRGSACSAGAGGPAHRRRHGAAAAHRRPGPRAGPDPYRTPVGADEALADRPGESRVAPGTARAAAEAARRGTGRAARRPACARTVARPTTGSGWTSPRRSPASSPTAGASFPGRLKGRRGSSGGPRGAGRHRARRPDRARGPPSEAAGSR